MSTPSRSLRPRTRTVDYSNGGAGKTPTKTPAKANGSGRRASTSSGGGKKAAGGPGPGALVLEYVIATRPWTFTASIMPILLTAVLLEASPLSAPFLSAVAAGLLVHAGSNLANTYYDFVSGRDTKKDSGDRALVDKVHITERGVLGLGLLCYAISTALVASTLDHSRYGDLLAVFAAGALLSFFYTAHPFKLKCQALGDVVVFLCFGPLLVQFTALLVAPPSPAAASASSWTDHIYWDLMPYTIPLGLLTEGILHANNARDMEMDAKAGTLTLARMLGFPLSRLVFVLLVAGSYATSLYLAFAEHVGNALVLLTLPLAVGTVDKFQEKTMALMPENVAKLHALYGGLTVLGVALSPYLEDWLGVQQGAK